MEHLTAMKMRKNKKIGRFLFKLNCWNRSIFLFLPHFRTQNRFTLLLEML